MEHQNLKKMEADSEFILSHIRLLALEYGATIIYTSGKANINLIVLYNYICHVLFNFELAHKPNFIEKEAYFIPSGYDDLKLLESNPEIKKYLEESYETRIKPVTKEKQIVEEDIQCEDTNTFFESLREKGIKGKVNIQKAKTKEISPPVTEQKKPEIKKVEIKKPEKELKNPVTKADKEKKFEEKKKDLMQKLGKKAENVSHNTGDKKEVKKISKAEEEKKNKIKENMLAKLKLKKDILKKK